MFSLLRAAEQWLSTPAEYVRRPEYQRLAIPYSFKPELSLKQAVIAAITAFLRILLGSVLFGVYGWPCLIAQDNVTGRKTRLALSRLTAPELAALADAIMAGGRRDAEGWQVAAALRQRAAPGLYR